MNTAHIATLTRPIRYLGLLGALFISQAFSQVTILEEAIESSVKEVLLPTSTSGTLVFRDCEPRCAVRSLRLNASSKFILGDAEVSLQELAAFAASDEDALLLVLYKKDSDLVTRLIAFSEKQALPIR